MTFQFARAPMWICGVAALLTFGGPAVASPHGGPTAETITPSFAETIASADTAEVGGLQLAQNRREARRRQARHKSNRHHNGRPYHRRPPPPPPHRVYHHGRPYYYRDGRYYDNTGAVLAAGALGLAAGAVLGGALSSSSSPQVVVDPVPAPYTAEWYRRCDLKYRSFRASDGTFMGYDGVRRTCVLP